MPNWINRVTVRDVAPRCFAKALCSGDDDPILFEYALDIAFEALVLRTIVEQQLAAVERLREPSAIALAKGDKSLKQARARILKAEQDYDKLVALTDGLLEKYKSQLPPPIVVDLPQEVFRGTGPIGIVPLHLLGFLAAKHEDLVANTHDQPNATVGHIEESVGERDEGAALEEAAADLIRLDRYEHGHGYDRIAPSSGL